MYSKISIVTPSYNQAQYIEETILSIINQNYPNLEYIIIDGGSTDGTVEIIKKYEKYLKYWVSEPDNGQWHAILKGVEHCTGELFNWINSDDLLTENCLSQLASHYSAGSCLAGNIKSFSDTESYIIENKNLSYTELILNKSSFNQQGFWFDLKNLKKILSDYKFQQFHYSFDRILTIEYLHKFPLVNYIQSDHIGKFRIHDASKTSSEWYKFDWELYTYYTINKNVFLKNLSIDKTTLEKLTKQYLVQSKVNFCTNKKGRLIFKKYNLLKLLLNYPSFIFKRYFIGALINF